MKTIREQVEDRRQSKLKSIRRQVKTGRLVVRQMTPEERERFPRPAPLRGNGSRP
jgi:hypothetical protein